MTSTERTNYILLWSKRLFPKPHSRKTHQRSSGHSKDHVTTCYRSMAKGHVTSPVAVCNASGKRHHECRSHKKRQQVSHRSVLRTETKARLGHFHPLGCPAYVLQNSQQAGQQIPKWHRRARFGLFLGHSPTHARSVALILNLNTGLVSAQFHVKFDNLFETVKDPDNEHPFLRKIRLHFVAEHNAGPPKIINRSKE